MVATNIRIRRGNKADLPSAVASGTPLWCEDTKELYIGTGDSVVKVGSQASVSNSESITTYTPVCDIRQFYVNGRNGYILYSNNFLVQWGYYNHTSQSAISVTCNLLRSFANTNFQFFRSPAWGNSSNMASSDHYNNGWKSKTVNSVTCMNHENYVMNGFEWRAYGYAG